MASHQPSEAAEDAAEAAAAASDEYRPVDHIDSVEDDGSTGPQNPRLGFRGWLRWLWRQLTAMRTAIILLLLLAIAAVPGSLVPQETSDPNGVISYHQTDPELSKWLDAFGLFNTFSTPWFSAIYLLLFISLIGCVIPRAWHHYKAMLARPPRTPARLARLEGYTTRPFTGSSATTPEPSPAAEQAVHVAAALLRRRGYRVARYTDRLGDSVSAERGYLRETGNLVFHVSLIGVLASVALGGSFGYTGQRVIPEGYAFTNVQSGYDSFIPGRFFTDTALPPFSIKLDQFDVQYEEQQANAIGAPLDYDASVTVTKQDGESYPAHIKVNEPLMVDGVQVYLLGNGYAPVLTVRDPQGNVVFSQPTLFRELDTNLRSLGVVKIPDGLAEQVGLEGFLYPDALPLSDGTYTSANPELLNPLVTLEVYTGDLGLDTGKATNAYSLDTTSLTKVAGMGAPTSAITLQLGQRVDLPNGLGSISLDAIPHFVALQMHHDPAQGWVFGFAVAAVLGLLTSLFIPRRRVWARALVASDGEVALEWAGLARGEDPRLADAVAELAGSVSGRETE